MKLPKVLLVCGSLRKKSSNAAILQAYTRMLPRACEVSAFTEIGSLPHFNPDDDCGSIAPEIVRWRAAISEADAVIISTPEYAHALPGSFKNALDWLVSDPAFAGKRVVILQAARGSDFAVQSLKEVLRTMSASILEEACVSLALGSNSLDDHQVLARADIRQQLELSGQKLIESWD